MPTVQSANAAIVDGLIRSGRSSGMDAAQLRSAGATLIGQMREGLANNPLLETYFPGLGEGVRALSASIETALGDLTREVPAALSDRIQSAYRGAVGNDAYGNPIQIGPLLQRELIDLATGFSGSPAELDSALRQHVLESQEMGDGRRAVVENAYKGLLGRASTLEERTELQTYVDSRMAQGASLEDVTREIQSRIQGGPEYARMERVGSIFGQVYSDHDAPGISTKRKWTDWVQSMMSRGMTEEQAFQYLVPALQGQS